MAVHTDIKAFWPSTNASIPENWREYTRASDLYLQGVGASEEPGSIIGDVNHSHDDTHSHSMFGHSHIMTISGGGSGNNSYSTGGTTVIPGNHTHPGIGFSQSKTPVMDSQTISTSNETTTGEPVFKTAILIGPTNALQDFPDGSLLYTPKTTAPTNWTIADGAGGTSNYANFFIKIAAEGANAGSTGGAATHLHTLIHTHPLQDHNHPDSNFPFHSSKTSISNANPTGFGSPTLVSKSVHHQAQSISMEVVILANATPTIGTASNDPSFIKLLVIENTSGSPDTPIDGVAVWVGKMSEIPNDDGWFWADGNNGTSDIRSVQIFATATGGDVLDTGGSDTHTHSIGSHGHSSVSSHGHTFSFVNITIVDYTGSPHTASSSGHTHTSSTMGSASVFTNSTSATTASEDGRAKALKIAWVQFTGVLTDRTRVHLKGGKILGKVLLK